MDSISTSAKIQDRINELDRLKNQLELLAKLKAETAADYEKRIAVVIVGLRNGISFDLDGKAVSDQPTTVVEKVARGICWQEKLTMDSAESAYKNILKIIDLTEAQLNGYQSINRYLSES